MLLSIFLLQLFIIIIASRLTGIAVKRIGQPVVLTMLVIMALATTLMTNPVLNLLNRFSKKVA